MLGLGAPELILILVAIVLLFGYKKLPDASRSLGRSLRIFKGEMKGMKDDDVRTRTEAETVHPVIENDHYRPNQAPTYPPKVTPVATPPLRSDDPR